MQYLTWKFRLARARFAERLVWRQRRLTVTFFARADDARFERRVSRFSPFSPTSGYRRVWLRRAAYWLHTPLVSFQRDLLRLGVHFTSRYQQRFGRLEHFDAATALKVEWLDNHSDYAAESMGDLSAGDPQYTSIYDDIDVPWSREPETWLVSVDQQGFLAATRYDISDNAWREYKEEELAIQRWHADDDDPFDGYFNREVWDQVMGFAREDA